MYIVFIQENMGANVWLLLGAKSMPFGCMSMARLGAKSAEVGCKSMESFGCMSMPFGCMYVGTVGCKVCGCWVQSMRRRLGACICLLGASLIWLIACLIVGSLPDSR